MLNSLYQALLNLVFPPKCPVCKQYIVKHPAFCASCLAAIKKSAEVSSKLHKLENIDRCYVVCNYSSGLKLLLHNVKYHNQTRFIVQLRWLLEQDKRLERYVAADGVVVPVPLHAARVTERGYNQTELIFKPWAAQRKLFWVEALTRSKPTVPQWQLTRSERRKNVKGAFTVTRPEQITEKHIILVDDIITTGATMEECSRLLKKAGAAYVTAVALAGGG